MLFVEGGRGVWPLSPFFIGFVYAGGLNKMERSTKRSLFESLTPKQRIFALEYIKDMSTVRAARAAGYSHPDVLGARLLHDKKYWKVQEYIDRCLKKVRETTSIEPALIIKELAKIAFLDPKNLLDENGVALSVKDIPPEILAAVSSMTVSYSESPDGDGNFVRVKHVDLKFYSKLEALKQLAQHLGLIGRDVHVNNNKNTVVINWQDLWGRDVSMDPVEERIAQAREVRAELPVGEKVLPKLNIEDRLRELEGERVE